ncbi:MAG: hypothetical protein KBB54_00030 [Candidatus Pacebacteria bacterium]|jgi:hypothetical protein|nr:hypothetical protein [Candidatus Paceibacterota bacterium]MBP9818616.1 hypothetical protein [Candidatus Paceibacterota bacterium]
MNPEQSTMPQESALEKLRKQALAIIALPTWPDDDMRYIKAERTRMLLCILIQSLELYFKGQGPSCIANVCTVAYEVGVPALAARELINKTVGIINTEHTNRCVDMSPWLTTSRESIASDFLKFLGNDFHFLFLVSSKGTNSPIQALKTLFPSLSAPYLGNPGECFVCFPGAAYCEAIKLPGNKGHLEP